ncbi:hypothetical protein PINS_up003841 [Pythium insidiosum]|nr:hypothetical protein PINS_up003841 [Pythium insidiosum]
MSRLAVAISHVELTEAEHTLYVIKVQQDADDWEVRRTYSDFRRLRDDVHRVLRDDRRHLVDDPCSREFARATHELPFPAKRLFGNKKDHVVKERAVELHRFLIKLLLLTHTYRKAQKALYDTRAPSPHERVQGSAGVFYLLRDFLKPADGAGASNQNNRGFGFFGGHATRTADTARNGDRHDDASQRMIRESKMLTMRTSHQAKAMSAPHLLQTPPSSSPVVPSPSQVRSPPAERIRTPTSHAAVPVSQIENLALESTPNTGASAAPQRINQTTTANIRTEGTASKTLKISSLHGGTRTPAPLQTSVSAKELTPRARVASAEKASERRGSVLRSISSEVNLIADDSDPVLHVRSSSSTTVSSSTSFGAAGTLHRSREANFTSGSMSSTTSGSSRRRTRTRKKSSRSMTAAERELRNSERLSRLNPQLTAQTITIEAQKELERHMSEYNAIMVLRYVDRFISKAVTKAPGCYVVQDKRIVIDSARFVEELEEVFADLPSSFSGAFKNDAGEWIFPKALDSYAQMKWNSFQGKDISRNGTYISRASDSDESDSEYEVHGDGGGYMRKKERAFTQDETDVLQKMIAQGTAGTDQMLRLRRQFDERGWHRHRLPGNEGHQHQHKFYSMESADLEEFSDTDDDDGSAGEASSVRRFQQQQNAMRKSRLSRREDIGGLV